MWFCTRWGTVQSGVTSQEAGQPHLGRWWAQSFLPTKEEAQLIWYLAVRIPFLCLVIPQQQIPESQLQWQQEMIQKPLSQEGRGWTNEFWPLCDFSGINSSQTDLPTILNPAVLAKHTEKATEFKKLHDCLWCHIAEIKMSSRSIFWWAHEPKLSSVNSLNQTPQCFSPLCCPFSNLCSSKPAPEGIFTVIQEDLWMPTRSSYRVRLRQNLKRLVCNLKISLDAFYWSLQA